MADLYGAAPSPKDEPVEISNFLLNQLLQNSSSSSSRNRFNSKYINSFSSQVPDSLPPHGSNPEIMAQAENRCRIAGSGKPLESEHSVRDGSSSVNFSDAGAYFGATVKDLVESVFFSVGDVSCESEKALELSDARSNPERPKTTLKRSRAAEVHNLSEKRRRSRINEKMKALQNLIPNSNKTDKASMLDEAIDYLKQLQLQVQMLTMRNGLSLYPVCLPGVLQPMQLPPTGMAYDEGNNFFSPSSGKGTLSANEENSIHAPFNLSNQCSISNQSIVTPSGPTIGNFEASFGFEASASAHYGSFGQSMSSKDACKECKPDLQFGKNRARNSASSGVS